MRDFNYEIKDTYAVISERKNGAERLELNAISYNGRETKIDLRRWDRSDGGKKMLKGITMTYEEAETLRDALNKLDFGRG